MQTHRHLEPCRCARFSQAGTSAHIPGCVDTRCVPAHFWGGVDVRFVAPQVRKRPRTTDAIPSAPPIISSWNGRSASLNSAAVW